MKKALLTSIIIILLAQELSSQPIFFSAKNMVTGIPLKLDSIRIQNLTQGKDSLLINCDSIDLSPYTDVLEIKDNIFSFVNINSIINEDNVNFSINLPQTSNLKIGIVNLMGESLIESTFNLSAGINQFSLFLNDISDGTYFITANNGTQLITQKFLKTGSGNNKSMKINYLGQIITNKIFEPGELYNFIGYSRSFSPDTLKNIVPQPSVNYLFSLKSLMNDYYTTGKIEIGGFDIKYEHFVDEWYQDGRNFNKKDTILTNFKLTDTIFNLALIHDDNWYYAMNAEFLGCPQNRNKPDSIDFCYRNFVGFHVDNGKWAKSTSILYQIDIDTSKKIISSINIITFVRDLFLGSVFGAGTSDNRINLNITLKNLSYYIDSDGKIIVEIIGNDVNNYFSKIKSYSNRYYSWGGSNTGQEDYYLLSLSNFSDKSYIKIELNP